MELVERYFSRIQELKEAKMDRDEFIKRMNEVFGSDEDLEKLAKELFNFDKPNKNYNVFRTPVDGLYNLENIKFTCGGS